MDVVGLQRKKILIRDVFWISSITAFILFAITNFYLQWVPVPTLENFHLCQFGVVFSRKCQKLKKQWFKQIGNFIFVT